MKTLLSIFSLGILIACSGTPSDNGTVITSVPGGGTVTPVKKAPGSILADFQNLDMPITCTSENCDTLGSSLQALEDSLPSFSQIKGSIAAITLTDGAIPIFDSVGRSLTLSSSIADGDVQNFFIELKAVGRVQSLIGGISLAFPSDEFTSSALGPVLTVLTTNRLTLIQYDKQIKTIDFVPGSNSFSGGVWSVDRAALQANFMQEFDAIKPSL